jgi:hypothetical protein
VQGIKKHRPLLHVSLTQLGRTPDDVLQIMLDAFAKILIVTSEIVEHPIVDDCKFLIACNGQHGIVCQGDLIEK